MKMAKKSPVKKDEGLKALAAKNPNLTYSAAKMKKVCYEDEESSYDDEKRLSNDDEESCS